MLRNKQGFLLIESLLLMIMVMVLSFLLLNCTMIYSQESKRELYDFKEEDNLMRQAYE